MATIFSLLKTCSRLALAVLAGLALIVTDVSTALAQGQACGQIAAILSSIERNPAFLRHGAVMRDLEARQAEVRQSEGLWVNGGCQQAFAAGMGLSRTCQTLAQRINQGRAEVERLSALARDGQSLAADRQRLYQDHTRYNCGAAGSGVTIASQPNPRTTLLDDIFGGGQPTIYEPLAPASDPWAVRQQTRRTVCVRTCDGYYWPISFSTTDAHIGQDAIRCHEMCPGTEVALFSYLNPGQEPEDMIALSGAPYRSMPYAFRYRSALDTNCSCRTETVAGAGALVQIGGGIIEEARGIAIALPRPDPRGHAASVVAEAQVPLPRPRPGSQVAAAEDQGVVSDPDLRIVDFDGRRVRIVGPETPFVPEPAGAS